MQTLAACSLANFLFLSVLFSCVLGHYGWRDARVLYDAEFQEFSVGEAMVQGRDNMMQRPFVSVTLH